MPGYAKAGEEAASRPSRILDFQTLYQQNCSGCHGSNGRDGAAIALNNPAYLAIAGAGTIRAAAAKGVSGTLMPAFARSAGGMLTDEQIDALVQGMLHTWARPSDFAGGNLPPYASDAPGNAMNGQRVYAAACARCHGADGSGAARSAQSDASALSIVDSSYLALVSDQSLRSIVLAGHPEKSTPDWRSYIGGPGGRALTAAEVNDVVAWIAGHRASANEQAASPNAKAGKETK
jgi:cytochrome c oxidase cbb3-type subunit 3/ubiquinol-cytochrome c reductase cytochrome c subunit